MSMIPLAGKRNHQGFSLMEVLIAIVILSVGLLGIAGLQAISIRNTHSAYLRSQATFLAYDIIDSIRANPDAIVSYAIGIGSGNGPAAHQSCEATNVGCTTTQMATHDLNIWKCSLGVWDGDATCGSANLNITGLLPGGDGSVAVTGNNVTVTVQWVDDRYGNTTPLVIVTQI